MRAIEEDAIRYGSRHMPKFQLYFRKAQITPPYCRTSILHYVWWKWMVHKLLYNIYSKINHIEINPLTSIGGGLYIGHPYCITINPKAVLGRNINIHKGVTIGQENRGKRKGAPTIGNEVWIGVNATIVGNVKIGCDVLIAPNSYINRDIPNHSVVFGNPCIIKYKENATEGYLQNKV